MALACSIEGACGSFSHRLSGMVTEGLEMSNWERALIGTSNSALDMTGIIPLCRLWLARREHQKSQRIRLATVGRS